MALLLLFAPLAARGETQASVDAALSVGITDNAGADFESDDPFGPRTDPGGFVALKADLSGITTRPSYRQVVAGMIEVSRFVAADAPGTRDLAGRFELEYEPGSWRLAARGGLEDARITALRPEGIVGPVPMGTTHFDRADASMSLGVDLSPSLTLTNDLAAVAEAVDVPALVARDDLTLALSLGRHTLELRGTAAAAEYKSGISDGPFADDLVAGAEAGWQVALGDDWAARASAGATYTRRDNRTFYFGQDKGIHVGVEPTAHVRVGRPRAFVEAARGVKLDALMHDTYVTTEALASFSQPLGTRFSIGAEGGVAQSVPLTDDNEDILTVRGAASFGWQLSKSLGLAARYELLHQEAFRTMRYQTVLVAAEVRGP